MPVSISPTTSNRAGSTCILTLSHYHKKMKNVLNNKSQVKAKKKRNK